MAKQTDSSPAAVLKALLEEYGLNPSKLAAAINLNQATIRLITLGKAKISVPAALRFAQFFGKTPEYWLNLQNDYDLAEAARDKELTKVLKGIGKAKKATPPAKKAAKATAKAGAKAGAKKAAAKDKAKPAAKASAKAGAKVGAEPKAPRGRKPAAKAADAGLAAPKKRGRKPAAAKAADAGLAAPKKRGRKPAATAGIEGLIAPKKRGRKPAAPKVAVESAPEADSYRWINPPLPPPDPTFVPPSLDRDDEE
jgi:addiction module HigA family antidote